MSDTEEKVTVVEKVEEEVVVDDNKKRKADDAEEIEIDLDKSIPLSKKQKRLLRRGKLDVDALNKRFQAKMAKKPEVKEVTKTNEDGTVTTTTEIVEHGCWIGNLSFDTTKEHILNMVKAKTGIEEDEISRFKLPMNTTKKNKGFCYIFFKKIEDKVKILETLNEYELNGRKLLIKDSGDYKGRPKEAEKQKNLPSRILFLGNLSFDTNEELLRKHFQHCGEIVRIRMATFEDSGKCKGFAFVDFKDDTGPTKAINDKKCKKIAGRPLRMEYGEDRSKRVVKPKNNNYNNNNGDSRARPSAAAGPKITTNEHNKPKSGNKTNNFAPNKRLESNNRVKSSIALAGAQRASAAIVPSQGKKVKFD